MKKVFLILALILGSWSMNAEAKVRTGQSDVPAAVVDVDHPGDSPSWRGSQIGGMVPGVVNFQTGQTSLYPFVGRNDSDLLPRTYIPVVLYGDFSGGAAGGGSSDSVLVWLTSAELLRWAQTFGYNDTSKLTTAELEQLADSIGKAVHRYDTGGGSGDSSSTPAAIFTGHATETTARAIDSSIRAKDTFTIDSAQFSQLAKDTPNQGMTLQSVNGGVEIGVKNFGGAGETTLAAMSRPINSIASNPAFPTLGDSGLPILVFDGQNGSWRPVATMPDFTLAANGQYGITVQGALQFTNADATPLGTSYHLPLTTRDIILREKPNTEVVMLTIRMETESIGLLTALDFFAKRSDASLDSVLVIPKGASSKFDSGTDGLSSTFQLFNFADTFASVYVTTDTDILIYVAPRDMNYQTDTTRGRIVFAQIPSSWSFNFTDADTIAVRTLNNSTAASSRFRVTLSKW